MVCNSSDVWESAMSWSATGTYGYILPNIGNDGGSCTTAKTGELIYTGTTWEYCTGSAWTNFGSGIALNNIDVELAAGSATAPSLSFYSDTNTGMYQASSGSYTINFTSNGTEIAAFDSSGDFNLTNTGGYGYEINGTKVLWLPDNDTTSIAVGEGALHAQNTTSSYNTALGIDALYDDTSGNNNTAIGDSALATNTTGNASTAVGSNALALSTGSPNTAVGDAAGKYITTGSDNDAFGYGAMNGISATPLTGNSNVAVGDLALYALQGAASYNTALGVQALYSDTTGGVNVGLGYQTLQYNTTGTNNTAVGTQAMDGISATPLTGSANTGLGNQALLIIRGAAANNTGVGSGAGAAITTGTDNTLLGYDSGLRSVFEQLLQQCGVAAAQVGGVVDGLMAQVTQLFDIPLYMPPMPIQDAIDLAEFLAQTAIGFTRFRAGSPTVGGPIEIAAVTKHDGFVWVRHKEYYDRRLNAHVI